MPMLQVFVNYAYIEIVEYLVRNVKPITVDEQLVDWPLILKTIFHKKRYIFPDFTLIDYLEILKDVKLEDDALHTHIDYGDALTVLNAYWKLIGNTIISDYKYHPYMEAQYHRLYDPMDL
jgi:hypothetical protein